MCDKHKLQKEMDEVNRLAELYRNSECWEHYIVQVKEEGLDEELADEVWRELNWKYEQ